ncbi:MAG: DUF4276 family protein [Gammaproteobacteria bacterium]|nr:DUF4276 family protein [Gammaproteobacteria bacterium]MYJ52082.1 DUF4276 family protein [Gammaproteobacteria bacterium]
MHFEILIEDQSGKELISALMSKILHPNASQHSWKIHPYKGIGNIPKGMNKPGDPKKRLLLDQLPRLLKGYGKSFRGFSNVVVVVVDLDDRNCIEFKQELVDLLESCNPAPNTIFRLAIEEIEAWLLGDIHAVNAAYPKAKRNILGKYTQDSICGTWEILADAIHSSGSTGLKRSGYPEIGRVKCEWARKIAEHMNVEENHSKSFQLFRDSLRRTIEEA